MLFVAVVDLGEGLLGLQPSLFETLVLLKDN